MSNATLTLSATIESILFFKGGTMTITELVELTGNDADTTRAALLDLKDELVGRGIQLIEHEGRVALATAPGAKEVIEALRRDELEGPLGRAGLETLAVVVYQAPVSRADIEYIRGVNVSSALRTLMIRGLIERVDNPKDKRSFLYTATADVPAYFGVSKLEDLPEFVTVRSELDRIVNERIEPDVVLES